MPSIPFLANNSFRKERLSITSFLIPTGLTSLWPAISKTIAVSLYSFEFGFVTFFLPNMSCTRYICSFESGSENSFERMRCIPNGFCLNIMKYRCCIMTLTMASLTPKNGVDNIHHIHRSTCRVLQSPILVSSSLHFVYGEVLLGLDC